MQLYIFRCAGKDQFAQQARTGEQYLTLYLHTDIHTPQPPPDHTYVPYHIYKEGVYNKVQYLRMEMLRN